MSDQILEDLTNAISKFKTTNLISVMFVVLVTIVLLIGMRHLFRNLKAAVVIAAVLMILQLDGIDITHIVVGLGVLVAVITLAMKDAFQDGLADAGLHIQYTQFVVHEK